MNQKFEAAPAQISALHKRWVLTLLTFGMFLWAMNALLAGGWSASIRWSWTIAAGAFCAYVLSVLWNALPLNYRAEDRYFFPYFGAGNLVSLLRGWFLAALAGFLITPLPSGWLAWLPGIFYILNGIADLCDGYLARRFHQVTRMGERLDMSLDGFGVLFASLLLFRYGTLPLWILLVGMARFIFLFVIKLREKLRKPVYALTNSFLRRVLAGAQMGFLGAVLLPVFTPPATIWAGVFFSFPFLINFGRDLLWVCGIRVNPGSIKWLTMNHEALTILGKRLLLDWLPLGLRLLVAFSLGMQVWDFVIVPAQFLTDKTPLGSAQTQAHLMLIFYGIGFFCAVLGFAGRVGAVLLLIGVGLQQEILSLGWLGFTLLCVACLLFFLGSGTASIWKPEEHLIRQRWEER